MPKVRAEDFKSFSPWPWHGSGTGTNRDFPYKAVITEGEMRKGKEEVAGGAGRRGEESSYSGCASARPQDYSQRLCSREIFLFLVILSYGRREKGGVGAARGQSQATVLWRSTWASLGGQFGALQKACLPHAPRTRQGSQCGLARLRSTGMCFCKYLLPAPCLCLQRVLP